MAKIVETKTGEISLTFDDVLIKPMYSEVIPSCADVRTCIARDIELNLPVLSAAMDTVTDSALAIALAQAGGLGVVHRNFTLEEQAKEIYQVKKFESGMVINPVTITPDATLSDVLQLMHFHKISGIPVVENNHSSNNKSRRLIGIITNRDVRFASQLDQKVRELMTTENLVTVKESVDQNEAKQVLHKNRIEKLLVIDNDGNCIGLITVKDIEKAQLNPYASKDMHGRLRVGAATGVGNEGVLRAERLIDAYVDVIVVDTAHGHSQKVIETVERIGKIKGSTRLIAGNVATAEGVKALVDAGVDGIKTGIGPGSICTTRIVAGVGVPQLSAIMETVEEAKKSGISVIADGGIKFSGDFAKAIGAGAQAVMIGSLLAGTNESPGDIYLHQGRSFKAYRGMGSVGAMARGSADRYFQGNVKEDLKFVPEGVEGQVPSRGPVSGILHQLVGGLQAAMGYVGAKNLKEFQEKVEFVRISNAGLHESHVHDVTITRESPNYQKP